MPRIIRILIPVSAGVLIAIGLMTWLSAAGWGATMVSGSSMTPTLYDGDVLITRSGTIAARGSIVIVSKPSSWTGGEARAGSLLVKRVIGVAGDRVCILADGSISSVHGCQRSVATRLDTLERTVTDNQEDQGWSCARSTGGVVRVTRGSVFLRGDDVLNSYDSRYAWCESEDPLVTTSTVRATVHAVIPIGRWAHYLTGGD